MSQLHNLSIESEDKSSGALIKGVALATVTNISELSTGKVKIKFQWRKKSDGTNDEILARIVTPIKGTPPQIEVHDVVLVAFEQDNFEYPFVIGFIYPNLKDTEA
jgi:uncharacterized protein involved in type VI secretion and phage assembly